jgi:hypothetical protein
MESEQLVVMGRAMEFETLLVYTIKEVAWRAVLATVSRQRRKYGYDEEIKAMRCVLAQVSVHNGLKMYQTDYRRKMTSFSCSAVCSSVIRSSVFGGGN